MTNRPSQDIIDQLISEYAEAVKRLQSALSRYLNDGIAPTIEERANCDFCYPELAIKYFGKERDTVNLLAFGKLEGRDISNDIDQAGTVRRLFARSTRFVSRAI